MELESEGNARGEDRWYGRKKIVHRHVSLTVAKSLGYPSDLLLKIFQMRNLASMIPLSFWEVVKPLLPGKLYSQWINNRINMMGNAYNFVNAEGSNLEERGDSFKSLGWVRTAWASGSSTPRNRFVNWALTVSGNIRAEQVMDTALWIAIGTMTTWPIW